MQSVKVSIDVPQSRDDVYDFLDVLGNHKLFTDPMMRDWRLSGPARGVGAKAKVNSVLGGRTEPIDLEVIEADRPVKSVERNIGAGGKRIATGAYTFDTLPDGGTRIQFEYAWEKAPLSERLAARMIRRMLRSALDQSMQRLAAQLMTRQPTSS